MRIDLPGIGGSLGQCVYRIGPPEGREYKGRPADACEALTRRVERFEVIDPADPVSMPEVEVNRIFPGTLDLRIPSTRHSVRSEAPEPLQ